MIISINLTKSKNYAIISSYAKRTILINIIKLNSV
nr:MAG TPA: hypothetical protein [Caudoviricetes sp.]